jgi:hypothetical protein
MFLNAIKEIGKYILRISFPYPPTISTHKKKCLQATLNNENIKLGLILERITAEAEYSCPQLPRPCDLPSCLQTMQTNYYAPVLSFVADRPYSNG